MAAEVVAASAISNAQWLQAGKTLGSAILGGSKSAAPAGPSSADAANYAGFDNSGWTVATGGAKASALDIPWPWLVGGAVLALLIWKKAGRK